jgi:hypothetical protein
LQSQQHYADAVQVTTNPDYIETASSWALAIDNSAFSPPSAIFKEIQLPIVACHDFFYSKANCDTGPRFSHGRSPCAMDLNEPPRSVLDFSQEEPSRVARSPTSQQERGSPPHKLPRIQFSIESPSSPQCTIESPSSPQYTIESPKAPERNNLWLEEDLRKPRGDDIVHKSPSSSTGSFSPDARVPLNVEQVFGLTQEQQIFPPLTYLDFPEFTGPTELPHLESIMKTYDPKSHVFRFTVVGKSFLFDRKDLLSIGSHNALVTGTTHSLFESPVYSF